MCGGGPTGVETAAVGHPKIIACSRQLNRLQEIYDLCQEDILQYVSNTNARNHYFLLMQVCVVSEARSRGSYYSVDPITGTHLEYCKNIPLFLKCLDSMSVLIVL